MVSRDYQLFDVVQFQCPHFADPKTGYQNMNKPTHSNKKYQMISIIPRSLGPLLTVVSIDLRGNLIGCKHYIFKPYSLDSGYSIYEFAFYPKKDTFFELDTKEEVISFFLLPLFTFLLFLLFLDIFTFCPLLTSLVKSTGSICPRLPPSAPFCPFVPASLVLLLFFHHNLQRCCKVV